MNKVLLVTGGSRGIGAATALLAAQNGWTVAVNYTANSLAADEVVRQIRSTGGNAIAVQADVADEAQVMRMYEHIDAKLGRRANRIIKREKAITSQIATFGRFPCLFKGNFRRTNAIHLPRTNA